MTDNEDKMFALLEEWAKFAAMLTGLRQQLIDQGWSSEAAERIVLKGLEGNPQ